MYCGDFCLSVSGDSAIDKEKGKCKREEFIRPLEICSPPPYSPMTTLPHARPIESERRFVSANVEALLTRVKDHFTLKGRRDWGILFENVFPNTLGNLNCFWDRYLCDLCPHSGRHDCHDCIGRRLFHYNR